MEPEPEARPELWTRLALVLLALTVALFLYLGMRPGGPGPIRAYTLGLPAVALASAVLAVFGMVRCFLRRPLVRPGRVRAFLALAAVMLACSYPLPYPSSHEHDLSAVRFELPVRGPWLVRWGGGTGRSSALVILPDRRFGLDLVYDGEADPDWEPGEGLDAWPSTGREVFAPAPGSVVRVLDGQPDRLPEGPWAGGDPAGNHVVLAVAEGEYVFLSNLRAGSIAVAEGDAVERGQLVGRVGNSGLSRFSPEPHLALHLQDTPDSRAGEAVPWEFRDYRADGRPVERGVPEGGQRVSSGDRPELPNF